MQEILKSASKIVLLLFALTLTIGTLSQIFDPEIFKNSIMIVLGYYFTRESMKIGQNKTK